MSDWSSDVCTSDLAARLGNGMDPDTEFGPLQNRARFEHVTSLIGEAGRLGKIVAGGQRVQGPGYFVRPTIVRDLPGSARLVRDEQFGPVVPVLCYAELADAITRINASEHRLGSSVWTSDPYRAYLVATRIESAPG